MSREPREHASAAAAAAAAAEAGPRGQNRLSLWTYNSRLSGSTRTFRDPFEVDVDVRRRFSTTNGFISGPTMAGGTRTLRDSSAMIDTPRPATRGVEARSSVDGGSAAASRMRATTTAAVCDSATAAKVERRASAPTRTRRRMSIQEWWTAKVNTATSSIKQASDSVQGSEGERLIEEEYNDADRLQPTDRDHGEPSRFALADVSRGNTIEVDVDNEKAMSPAPSVDVNNPCADATRDFQTYLEGDYDSGSGNSTDMSGDGEVGMSPPSTSSRLIHRSENETAQTSSQRQELHQSNSEIHPVFYKEPTDDLKDIYSNMGEHEESRRVTFLSGTMGLTVDTTDLIRPHPSDGFHWKQHDHHLQQQTHDDHEEWPASPCSGVILETSPRYGNLQAFRKEMSSRGINAQMFHTGWKARLLPAREIRLFLTDSRKSSVIYWRYKKNPRRGRRVTGGAGDLGAEDRLVIPLSSLANIGPAELYPQRASTARRGGERSSWFPVGASLRGRGEESTHSGLGNRDKDFDSANKDEASPLPVLDEDVPVVALSYWPNGEPRWEGDQPKRLLVKPESFDTFRRLTQGLRLCCLHFYNHSCPQDLEDIR